jgi:hypothetical protein
MKKQCFKCKQIKLLSDFYSHPKTADRHLNKCKDCTRKDTTARRFNPQFRQYVLEYDRLRNGLPSRIKGRVERLKRERKMFPEKGRARGLIMRLVKTGKLKRLPCEKCGNIKTEAHHPDYSKPAKIKWLCVEHHKLEHFKR